MVVVQTEKDKMYLDGYLKNVLDKAKVIIKKDWDMCFLIDGKEREGKSILSMNCAAYCDPNFNIDKICFTPDELHKVINEAPKYSAVVYDEAFSGLNSRATMSMINRTIVQHLAEVGQKNLFLFVNMPTFFDLDRYVSIHRSRALCHVYHGENFERGHFAYYDDDKKKDLYLLGKKFYSYKTPRPNFIGRFTNHYPIDEVEYRKRKLKALRRRELGSEELSREKEITEYLFSRLLDVDKDNVLTTHEVKAKILKMPIATYYLHLRQAREQRPQLTE